MGKKVKKRTTRNAQKEKQFSTSSPKNISQKIIRTVLVDGVSVVKEAKVCPHLNESINLEKFSSKITSFESLKCDDCRASKVKGKHGKKKGGGSTSESKSIWVCLACGHFTCGGVGFPTTPHSHATRHAKQNHHPLAVQFSNPNLRWCFTCNTLIPVQSLENGEQKDALLNFVKLLKTRQSSENSLDVENVWFGSGSSGSVTDKVNSVNTSENSVGYTVKGLLNLGNTCFFNSILQNLLAMNKLRYHYLRLEKPIGPLTVSLKKLFVETNQSTGSKNVVNPRALFNSVCTMASQFKGYQQQDSHELLRFLLDGLSNEESVLQNCVPKHSTTFVDIMFGGQISSSVSCLECGHTSIVYEPYLDLSLPLPTKKSPSKHMPPVSRSKKLKQPPKRRENFGEKVENVIEKMSENKIKESDNSSDNLALVNYVEPNTLLNSNGNPTVDSFDFSSWLDYVEPTSVSSDRDAYACNGDDAVTDYAELANDSSLDYHKPSSSSNDHNMSSQIGSPSVIQNSGNGDDVLLENEPRIIQESEVLLLPYEKIISTSNGYEQELSDFDGFGGLFDEPEVVSGPTVDPVSNQVEGNGNMVTNNTNSDSDSDEVDNSDSPVSVDKCLAYFTTSEILTKTEHAWHCEQCSKNLVEQRMKLKNKLHKPVPNGPENGISSISSDSGVEYSVSNGLHNDKNDCSEVASELEERGSMVNGEESCTVQDTDACHVDRPDDECKDEKVQKSVSNRLARENVFNGVEDNDVDSKSVKVARDASKRILINRVPPILTIHLKRLSQDARGRLSKLNGHVDFKDVIDLKPYMDPGCKDKGTYKYRLIGVVEHIGTMRGGHYVAYVRGGTKYNNDCLWYNASDAHVREVSLEEVLKCEAYILFYEKI